jgi:Gpi18-like mannosyltransferase
MIRLFSFPLSLFGMNPIATATLAGVVVSALGTLLAMFSLYDLTHETLGDEGGMRAIFYLLIFPTGFFLAQVYTEGLFVGLAFTSLAMLKRKHWVYAALLACVATLTRAVGIALVIPMIVTWIRTNEWYALDLEWRQLLYKRIPATPLWHAFLAFAPLMVFLIWKFSYFGLAFDYVESNFFGRALSIGDSFYVWVQSSYEMVLGFLNVTETSRYLFANPQHSAYYFMETVGIVVGLIAIVRCLKTDPEVAWFSLAVYLISFASGPGQGMYRYVLAAPALFITLSRWGRNPTFDRIWTLISILLMGLSAMLYAMNNWVG